MNKSEDSTSSSSSSDSDDGEVFTEYQGLNGVFSVGSLCKKTNPCKHSVKINGKTGVKLGDTICKLFLDNKLEVPLHFALYKQRVARKQNK